MLKLTLLPETHPLLQVPTERVSDIRTQVCPWLTEMFRVMRDNNGIGLAANQVGIGRSFFIADIDGHRKVYVNPEIVEQAVELEQVVEGCLSFPGIHMKVSRPAHVRARYTTSDGYLMEEVLSGIEARVYLHELDHLNGKTFNQRVSNLVWDMARKKRNKKNRGK